MKKIPFIILLILCFSTTVVASASAESLVEPRASYVFMDVSSMINKSGYGGDCSLTDEGSGTMSIYLQKKVDGVWETVDGSKTSKTFSEIGGCTLSKAKTLSKGTYRCKTYVIGYVNGYTDRRTVYSPTLTVN